MFKTGDKVVFTQHVIDLMEANRGESRKIFEDDCTLTDRMYEEAIKEEYLVFSKVHEKLSRMEKLKFGNLNWDVRWFKSYEEGLEGAEDF